MRFEDLRGPAKWAGTAEAYAESFAHLCEGAIDLLLAAVGLPPADGARDGARGGAGERRILDVGTGPGTLAARAAERGAAVVAVDPEPGMLRLAAATAPGAEVRRAAVPGLPFPAGSFDVVVANFVVNHVDDPEAAVHDLARVTAPGGRAGVTTWPPDRGVLGDVWVATLAAGGADASALHGSAAVRGAQTPEGLAALMREAGFAAVDARTVGWTCRIDPERLWHGAANGVAAVGHAVAATPLEARARMRAAYDRSVAPLLDGGLLAVPLTAVLAVGEKPAEGAA